MRQLDSDVDVVGAAVHRVHILGEAFPFPRKAFVKRRAGDVLHPLHQADQRVVIRWTDRRETDAAVAGDNRGCAQRRGRIDPRRPADLTIVMGVDIDPARGQQQAVGVNLPPGGAGDAADIRDAVALHRHVRREARTPRAINDGRAPDHQIMHRPNPLPTIRLARDRAKRDYRSRGSGTARTKGMTGGGLAGQKGFRV